VSALPYDRRKNFPFLNRPVFLLGGKIAHKMLVQLVSKELSTAGA
jgi:hypothetical protein